MRQIQEEKMKNDGSTIARHMVLSGLAILPLLAMLVAVSTAQAFQTLYVFNGGTDGRQPMAGLILDGKGTLYGTTEYGGIPTECGDIGCGTVFKLNPSKNKYAVLHRFNAYKEGYNPTVGLVRDAASGYIYGLTGRGVFELDPKNQFKTLYTFTSESGYNPQGGLLLDPLNHTLYGTTENGGTYGWGTVFSVNSGGQETTLYNFPGQPNGANPQCTLISVRGDFFGTTLSGGTYNNGTVFSGSGNVIYSFDGDYGGPYPGLASGGPAGNPVGVTTTGGDFAQGSVYGFTNAGEFRTLYRAFNGQAMGETRAHR
jgi:uncharacterized repeat protein (TIGR03803 family)